MPTEKLRSSCYHGNSRQLWPATNTALEDVKAPLHGGNRYLCALYCLLFSTEIEVKSLLGGVVVPGVRAGGSEDCVRDCGTAAAVRLRHCCLLLPL